MKINVDTASSRSDGHCGCLGSVPQFKLIWNLRQRDTDDAWNGNNQWFSFPNRCTIFVVNMRGCWSILTVLGESFIPFGLMISELETCRVQNQERKKRQNRLFSRPSKKPQNPKFRFLVYENAKPQNRGKNRKKTQSFCVGFPVESDVKCGIGSLWGSEKTNLTHH